MPTAKPAVLMGIGRQPGANIIETVDRIMALLPELRASIPPTVKLDTNYNRTTTIRASVKDIEFTLLLTVALVVMVIFLFLRNAWATIIPSIAVPLSIVGTFGVMYLLHYSLDNLSLMALAICTGFVVDDAIVVIENITRYLEAGDSPMRSGHEGLPRDRIYGAVDEHFADRGIHSAAADGRDHRKAVSRICGHLERGHRCFPVRVAHHHAHDVRAISEIAKGSQARQGVSGERASVSMEPGNLCGRIALGSAPPALHARRDGRDHLPERVSIYRRFPRDFSRSRIPG